MLIGILGSRDGRKEDITSIRNTADLRSWFFTKYLSERGHEVDYYRWNWNIPVIKRQVDHFICTINGGGIHRLIEKLNIDVCKVLRPSVKKYIVDMSDSQLNVSKTDKFFCMIPLRGNSQSSYIGWAADDKLLFPEKTGKIRVLVDHSLYINGFDASETVIKGLQPLKKNIDVYQIRNDGLIKVNLGVPYKKEIYDRHLQIPYPDICKEYNKSNIFVVTHTESLGLSVIESAMAGAHILLYKGSLKNTLIEPLSHSFYEECNSSSVTQAVHNFIFSKTSPESIRDRALPWTWNACIDRVEKIINS